MNGNEKMKKNEKILLGEHSKEQENGE